MHPDTKKIRSIQDAELKWQYARELCLRGLYQDVMDLVFEIGAFYERASLKGRARACELALEHLMQLDGTDVYAVLDVLNNFCLGPEVSRDPGLLEWG